MDEDSRPARSTETAGKISARTQPVASTLIENKGHIITGDQIEHIMGLKMPTTG
jgi:hypothetical protein